MSISCQKIEKPLIQCETYGCKKRSKYRMGSSKFPHTCTDLCESCTRELFNSMNEVLGEDLTADFGSNNTLEALKAIVQNATGAAYETGTELLEHVNLLIKRAARTSIYKDVVLSLNENFNITSERVDEIASQYGIKFGEDMVNKQMKFQYLVKFATGELDVNAEAKKAGLKEEPDEGNNSEISNCNSGNDGEDDSDNEDKKDEGDSKINEENNEDDDPFKTE